MTYEYYCGRLVVDWPGAPQNMKSQAAATKNKVGLPLLSGSAASLESTNARFLACVPAGSVAPLERSDPTQRGEFHLKQHQCS